MNLAYKKKKFWDLGRTPPPPFWEKFPNNIVFFLWERTLHLVLIFVVTLIANLSSGLQMKNIKPIAASTQHSTINWIWLAYKAKTGDTSVICFSWLLVFKVYQTMRIFLAVQDSSIGDLVSHCTMRLSPLQSVNRII